MSNPPIVRQGFKSNRQVNFGAMLEDIKNVEYVDFDHLFDLLDAKKVVLFDVRGEVGAGFFSHIAVQCSEKNTGSFFD